MDWNVSEFTNFHTSTTFSASYLALERATALKLTRSDSLALPERVHEKPRRNGQASGTRNQNSATSKLAPAVQPFVDAQSPMCVNR